MTTAPTVSCLLALASIGVVAGLSSGCAAVSPQQAVQRGGVARAAHFPELIRPEMELPDWEAPRVDLARLAPLAADRRRPSNDRDWIDEQRVLARATFDGDRVHVQNIRNAEFFTYRDCLVDYYDKTFDLKKIKSVDFLMVPFNENRAIAHTMLSFGFEGGDYLGVSVEVRLEKGETYDAAIGLFNQFELIYVVADERDLIPVRVLHRNADVFLYRTTATPEMARRLFIDVMNRVNKLYDQPEFYDTLSNNCTTNIVRHINSLVPGRVPYDYRVLLPGFADSLAYELGLIDNSRPLEEVRRRARINELVIRYHGDPHFSQRIRGERPVR